jgi:hypothetical protein
LVATRGGRYHCGLLRNAVPGSKAEKFNKSERNASLRQALEEHSQASFELKHHDISAVISSMDLPFISGYNPRGNRQLLLRKAVQKFILDRGDMVWQMVDTLEEVKIPTKKQFRAVLMDAPAIELIMQLQSQVPRVRVPRKTDFAARAGQVRVFWPHAGYAIGRMSSGPWLPFHRGCVINVYSPRFAVDMTVDYAACAMPTVSVASYRFLNRARHLANTEVSLAM